MTKYALIVAGGSGSRMKSELPKQFILLNGKPILMHTIEKFYEYDNQIAINLVLPKDQFHYWDDICEKHNFKIPLKLIEGGETRFQSVKNGLNNIENNGTVAIHDGVRPFISNSIINNNFITAAKEDSALTVVDLKDSIRINSLNESKSLIRTDYKLVQTPQTFNSTLIKEAYNQKELLTFTDDASVFEAYGGKINLVEGDYHNIKITTPEDLLIAKIYAMSF